MYGQGGNDREKRLLSHNGAFNPGMAGICRKVEMVGSRAAIARLPTISREDCSDRGARGVLGRTERESLSQSARAVCTIQQIRA